MELLRYKVSIATHVIHLQLTYCVVNLSNEDERMRIFANLLIDRILDEQKKGLLRFADSKE